MELMEPLLNQHNYSLLKIKRDTWYITKMKTERMENFTILF